MVFKKQKNAFFQIATELYNTAILQNQILKPYEIERAFEDAPYELIEIDAFCKEFMKEVGKRIGFGMFIKAENGFRPANKVLVPAVLSSDEKEWLKAILNDDKINLFLDHTTQQKLSEALAQDVLLYEKKDVYVQKNTTQQDFTDENLQRVFKTVLRGIAERKHIRFEYYKRKNDVVTTISALPLKIHYHGVNDSFQCIVFDIERNFKTTTTLNMDCIKSATIIDDIVTDQKKQLENTVETAEIELRNEKNLPTQCFMLLSDYKKTVFFDEARNLYHISIQYYDFERQDLFKNILSLGEYCVILSPASLVEQIKKRLERLSFISAQDAPENAVAQEAPR
jgi:predicted DNA-binding transcriptional regulator YafY